MLRCFALIALPIFSLFALAAESAAAPIEPLSAAPLATAPVNPEIQHAPPQQ